MQRDSAYTLVLGAEEGVGGRGGAGAGLLYQVAGRRQAGQLCSCRTSMCVALGEKCSRGCLCPVYLLQLQAGRDQEELRRLLGKFQWWCCDWSAVQRHVMYSFVRCVCAL